MWELKGKHKWKKEGSLTICEKCGKEKEVSFVEGHYGKYGSPDG
ncbi:MAG: hypothetical protein WA130_01385 [Candidatus Methanoperedens sp.]